MRQQFSIILLFALCFFPQWSSGQAENKKISFDFYGDTIEFPRTKAASVAFCDTLSAQTIGSFYERMMAAEYQPMVDAILAYKSKHNPDDWVYYQLIRKTAQSISPKADNYFRYTLYKWFLLSKSGYDAALNIVGDKLLFYVQSDDDIYDLPYFTSNNKKYICLNYHDYGYSVNFDKSRQLHIAVPMAEAKNRFSYKLTQLPDFTPDNYQDKDLQFKYHDVSYHFKIKVNEEVKKIFTNYPVVEDYQLYFNEPLSKETYNSLIPQLKDNIKGLSVKNGVDYLMHFTRYAFLYETDRDNFGREKHLSPEQTLLYDHSDCEDRAALFYCLVKEVYNLPMIVLSFPHHVTVAVKLDRPVGKQIMYNGTGYSVCEPTPQTDDLPVGALSPDLQSATYEIAYSYTPALK